MQHSLTAAERETVITASDEDGHMIVWTAQRPMITKLRRNPAAVLIEEGKIGSSVWARFQLPAGLLTIRNPRQPRVLSEQTRQAMRERAAQMRTAA